jgi:hypothetical protein
MKKSINVGKLLVLPYESFSNYINLPPTALDRLSKLHTNGTYFFEIKGYNEKVSYVGVKEFISEEECVEVPSWMAQSMEMDYVNVVLMKDIPKGDYARIEPLSEEFFNLPDNDKIMEELLSNYCLLTLNQIICIKIFDEIYKFNILEIKSFQQEQVNVIDITNIDLKVDFYNRFLEEREEKKRKEDERIKIEEDERIKIEEEEREKQKIEDSRRFMEEEENDRLKKEKDNLKNAHVLGGQFIHPNKLREERLKYYEKLQQPIQEKKKIKIVHFSEEVNPNNNQKHSEVIDQNKSEINNQFIDEKKSDNETRKKIDLLTLEIENLLKDLTNLKF